MTSIDEPGIGIDFDDEAHEGHIGSDQKHLGSRGHLGRIDFPRCLWVSVTSRAHSGSSPLDQYIRSSISSCSSPSMWASSCSNNRASFRLLILDGGATAMTISLPPTWAQPRDRFGDTTTPTRKPERPCARAPRSKKRRSSFESYPVVFSKSRRGERADLSASRVLFPSGARCASSHGASSHGASWSSHASSHGAFWGLRASSHAFSTPFWQLWNAPRSCRTTQDRASRTTDVWHPRGRAAESDRTPDRAQKIRVAARVAGAISSRCD